MIINKRKSTQQNTSFDINGRKVSDSSDIENHFNNYFLNAPQELCKQFPAQSKDPKSYLKERFNDSIYMKPTTNEEISKILLNMKNSSPGHDDIDVKILKKVSDSIVVPITHLCNLSLSNGNVPNDLKIAKIVPIYKKGTKDKLSNYRPVSVLPALSKIYERLVYNRLVNFLDKHKILNKQQFGFRKNHSTSLAISALVDQFHETVERNEFMLGLFIDLSRAFDTISHKILLDKLCHYGIRGIALDWIKNYLSNRKQFVVFNHKKSSMGNVNIGVPQGSILGPLLFLLYLNDLSNTSTKLSFIQFADDTSIFIKGKSVSNMCKLMNSEIKHVSEWLKNNMLTLNVSKTNYMIMASQGKKFNNEECEITIDEVLIKHVNDMKFLGIILDNKLTWNFGESKKGIRY